MANWIRRLVGVGARGETLRPAGLEWQRIAELTVEGVAGKGRLQVNPESSFGLIKLRSRHGVVEVYRWTLDFDDGTRQELSMNCLFEGGESRPVLIAGRHIKGMTVEYDAPRTSLGGVLEILAQPYIAQ